MLFTKTTDYKNNELTFHTDDMVVKYVDSTHVTINGIPYHIGELEGNPHYESIKTYIKEYRAYEKHEEIRTWFGMIFNLNLLSAAYKVKEIDENASIEDCGFQYVIEFSSPEFLKRYFRLLPMNTSLKNKLKRRIKRITPDNYTSKIFVEKDPFGSYIKITDKDVEIMTKKYQPW